MKRFYIFNLVSILFFSFSLRADFLIKCETAITQADTALQILNASGVIDDSAQKVLQDEVNYALTFAAAQSDSLHIDAQQAKDLVASVCSMFIQDSQLTQIIENVFSVCSAQNNHKPLQTFSNLISTEQFLRNFSLINVVDNLSLFHVNSISQLNGGWTCGMFCLYNAFEIERALGIEKLVDFISACTGFCQTHQVNPCNGVRNDTLIELADSTLLLQNVYPLILKNGRIQPIIKEHHLEKITSPEITAFVPIVERTRNSITVQLLAPAAASQSQMAAEIEEAEQENLQNLLYEIKDKITNKNTPQVAHFICSLDKENHWILISVICLPNEQPFIVLADNLNAPITDSQETQTYVQQLNEIFC